MSKPCDPKNPKAIDPKYICNPATGKWVLKTGAVGKRVQSTAAAASSKPKAVLKKPSSALVPPPVITGVVPCPPGKILNPRTGRCVSKTGAVGKKLLAPTAASAKLPTATSKPSSKPKPPPSYTAATVPAPNPLTTTVRPSSSPAPIGATRLLRACQGKSKKAGGMNVNEMYRVAKARGYTGTMKRDPLIKFLCKGTPSPVASTSPFSAPASGYHSEKFRISPPTKADAQKLKKYLPAKYLTRRSGSKSLLTIDAVKIFDKLHSFVETIYPLWTDKMPHVIPKIIEDATVVFDTSGLHADYKAAKLTSGTENKKLYEFLTDPMVLRQLAVDNTPNKTPKLLAQNLWDMARASGLGPGGEIEFDSQVNQTFDVLTKYGFLNFARWNGFNHRTWGVATTPNLNAPLNTHYFYQWAYSIFMNMKLFNDAPFWMHSKTSSELPDSKYSRLNYETSVTFSKSKPAGVGITPRIAPTSYQDVKREDVPDEALSVTMYSPYNEDDDYKSSRFVKLTTCKKCPNQGVFEKEELDDLVNKTMQYHCPFCSEQFEMLTPSQPPYGHVNLSAEFKSVGFGLDKKTGWFILDFEMDGGVDSKGKKYSGRSQTAYVPFNNQSIPESMLACWLLVHAFEKNAVFSLGTSVTHGGYGIVFSGVHLKTDKRNDQNGHGYEADVNGEFTLKAAVNHLIRQGGVLENIISECAGFGIYTPMMIDDMNQKHPNGIDQRQLCKLVYRSLEADDITAIDEQLSQDGENTIKLDYCDKITKALPPGSLDGKGIGDVADLVTMVKATIRNLEDIIADQLKDARQHYHYKGSEFMEKYIHPPLPPYFGIGWNRLGFTQIEPNPRQGKAFKELIPRGVTKSDKPPNKWSILIEDKPTGVSASTKKTLLDIANYTVKGEPTSILVFHGTPIKSVASILKGINWTMGDGALDKGFYLTLNPNEAKGYACDRAGSEYRHRAKKSDYKYVAVFEFILKNADQIEYEDYNYQNFATVRNPYYPPKYRWRDSYQDQFRGRQAVVDNLEIQKVHIFNVKNLYQSSDLRLSVGIDYHQRNTQCFNEMVNS